MGGSKVGGGGAEGGGVVIVSHDQYFVSRVARDAFVVAKGAVKKAESFAAYVKKQHARLN